MEEPTDGVEEEAGGGSSVKAAEKGVYVIVEYEGGRSTRAK